MLGRIRSRLTYANVMATIAVFMGLGGSAYAAMQITGKDVENGTLSGIDVRNQSLTGLEIRGLTRKDFKRGRIHTAANTDVVKDDATVESDGTGAAAAVCPPGKLVTGGGFQGAANTADAPIRDSIPAGINAWFVFVEGGVPGTEFAAYAVCSG